MPIDDNFTFNGQNSADFGLSMASDPEAIHPERRGKISQIVGRNGIFVREDGSYDTYTQTYDVLLDSRSEGVYARSRKVANWLLGSRGFCRLEDTFEPDVFKIARYAKQLSVENRLTRFGRAQIAFEVQPQRYLKLGETEISVESDVDGSGIYSGSITFHSIPYGAQYVIIRTSGGSEHYGGEYIDENGNEIGSVLSPDPIPDGTAKIKIRWFDARQGTHLTVRIKKDESGNEVPIAGVFDTSPIVFNPTDYEARPLMKFVDTSEEPSVVPQTLTANDGTIIAVDGEVSKPTWESGYSNPQTSEPVSVNGYAYAYVWGNSYAFYDSNVNVVSFDTTSNHKATGLFLYGEKIVIPATAATIVVGSVQVDNPPAQGNPNMALSLQAARSNPGASAVTINGTTISLDFSVHDTIYLDCDLHDAYYIDGSSANDKVTFSSNIDPYPTFPGFVPGENTVIVRDGDNLDFSVVPRWWEL